MVYFVLGKEFGPFTREDAMKWMRFSIAGLMGFVLIAALGFGGLKAANEYWASGCFTLMVVALVVAILNAVQGRGKDRAYWAGFAISGWIYYGIVFAWAANPGRSYPFLPVMVFEKLEPLFHPELSNFSVSSSSGAFYTIGTTTFTPTPMPIAPPAPLKIAISSSPTVSTGVPTPILTPPTPPIALAAPPARPVALTMPPTDMTWLHYSRVAHSLTALLVGMLGGTYSAWQFARRERREAEAAPEVSPSSP